MEHINETLTRALNNLKPVLTLAEACEYCGISASAMYKYTASNKIPFYKPEGKLIYFKRVELDEWMTKNRQSTYVEMNQVATSYTLKNRKF